MNFDLGTFKNALSSFPSGVVIATTVDSSGDLTGFTASSFSAVSLDPPVVSVCLANSARSYESFRDADEFYINLLRPSHEEAAMRFATRGANKFGGDDFEFGPSGEHVLKEAVATFTCARFENYPCGDHIILAGRVVGVAAGPDFDALMYYRRKFYAVDEHYSNSGHFAPELPLEPLLYPF